MGDRRQARQRHNSRCRYAGIGHRHAGLGGGIVRARLDRLGLTLRAHVLVRVAAVASLRQLGRLGLFRLPLAVAFQTSPGAGLRGRDVLMLIQPGLNFAAGPHLAQMGGEQDTHRLAGLGRNV
ncbi:hypothetical protein D3C86_1566300 [compost metagenome]